MFGNKSCKKCNNLLKDKYKFCPTCGSPINYRKEKDFGMLGENDSDFEDSSPNYFGLFNERTLGKMIGDTIKMIEKEMQKEIKNTEKNPKTNFRLMINGKEINVNQKMQKEEMIKNIPRREFKKEQLKIFVSLPREEPKTRIKRLDDKIVYEIDIPETKSPQDILINQLENSIEIKAIGKTKSYVK